MGTNVTRMDHKPLATTVSQTVLDVLAARSISQRVLSEQTGIPFTTLHRRLHGSPFTIDELEKVGAYLGITVTQLVSAIGTAA